MLREIGKLKKLYSQLLNDISEYKEDICTFFLQVGNKFYSTPIRILFIGKAVNKWITSDRNVDGLFNEENPERIVNRHDQLKWVHDQEGKNEIYNTKRSAFWRVIKKVSVDFLDKEDWYNYIAWSNLYKIAPWKGGNPSCDLQKRQRKVCISILLEEIKLLEPDFVVFFTSSWEDLFLESLGIDKKMNRVESWNQYSSFYQKVDNVTYIQSHHPQGKAERKHIETIVNIMKKVAQE